MSAQNMPPKTAASTATHECQGHRERPQAGKTEEPSRRPERPKPENREGKPDQPKVQLGLRGRGAQRTVESHNRTQEEAPRPNNHASTTPGTLPEPKGPQQPEGNREKSTLPKSRKAQVEHEETGDEQCPRQPTNGAKGTTKPEQSEVAPPVP
nr:pollen-specific leucine-rich repeat extensin-like protein 1 [Procambarus clarkii]